MKWSFYVGAAIFMALVWVTSANLSGTDKATINNGLAAGAAIADAIEKYNFTGTLTKLASSVAPFLGALGPIVSLVLGLFGTRESAEMTYLKKMMKHIDSRFDRLDGKFADLNRKIDYVHIQIQFGIIESKILAMSTQFQKFYNAPAGAVQQEKKDFITAYESDYQNSADKIYDGIMNEKGTFTESLGEAAMSYSENDRKAVQEYMIGVLKLLLQGVKIELAYKKANGANDADVNYIKGLWEGKIAKVRSKMISIDHAVAAKYITQMTADVDRIAKDNQNLKNSDFSSNVYHFLVDKYFWRDWFVLIYNDITGGDKHWQKECSGYLKFRHYGRNIIVASVDERKSHVSHTELVSTVNHVSTATRHERHRPSHKIYYTKINADQAFNTFAATARSSCSKFASIGLVQDGSDQHYQGPSDRLVHLQKRYYTVHAFG